MREFWRPSVAATRPADETAMTIGNKPITVRLLRCNCVPPDFPAFRCVWKLLHETSNPHAAFGGFIPCADRGNGRSAADDAYEVRATCHDFGQVGRHERTVVISFCSDSADLGSDQGHDAQGMGCSQAGMGDGKSQVAGLQPESRRREAHGSEKLELHCRLHGRVVNSDLRPKCR